MTIKEQQTIENLSRMVIELKASNENFKTTALSLIEKLNTKVEEKHIPLTLEQTLLNTVQSSMQKAFSESLTGYNSPLQKYVLNIVSKHQTQIESVFNEAVNEVISTDEFKQNAKQVLLHKISKSMLSGIDGSVEKTINLMKQDPIFKSKLVLAVNNIVLEFLANPS